MRGYTRLSLSLMCVSIALKYVIRSDSISKSTGAKMHDPRGNKKTIPPTLKKLND